jgi:hypothetical protein
MTIFDLDPVTVDPCITLPDLSPSACNWRSYMEDHPTWTGDDTYTDLLIAQQYTARAYVHDEYPEPDGDPLTARPGVLTWVCTDALWTLLDDGHDTDVRLQAELAIGPAPVQPPVRGDHIDQWLRAQRDEFEPCDSQWDVIDNVLDQYRLHADTGTPLDEHCCEGRVIGDCECFETEAGDPT